MVDRAARLAEMRRAYRTGGLDAAELAADPFAQFARWLADAVECELDEPNAMLVSTAGADGRPTSRTVLLKAVDARGFVFFTNYTSRKGRQIAENPHVALLFPWHAMSRQVGVVGSAERVSAAETAAYFASRPRGSQLGAWASRQSAVIPSRAVLEERWARLSARWPDEVPVPPFWGGLRVVPETVEFWQGRPDRLHDRLRYRRVDDGWVVERLSP
jgi:pyridoxamine 5'-phosphate oxidase